MGHITIEKHDRVALMTMNYKKENRFNPDVLDEMLGHLDEIENDDSLGAVVVTGGDPKFFSNGLDLEWLMMNSDNPEALMGYLKKVNDMFKRWCLYPKPTVAALNGHTFAAGLFMAAYMDFRFMREDRGWICLPEVDINIPLLPAMIAVCQAVMTKGGFRELYYTGIRMTAQDAMRIGYVDKALPLDDLVPKSIEMAGELAKKKTATYAEMKRRIREYIAVMLDEEDPKYFEQTLKFSLPS